VFFKIYFAVLDSNADNIENIKKKNKKGDITHQHIDIWRCVTG